MAVYGLIVMGEITDEVIEGLVHYDGHRTTTNNDGERLVVVYFDINESEGHIALYRSVISEMNEYGFSVSYATPTTDTRLEVGFEAGFEK